MRRYYKKLFCSSVCLPAGLSAVLIPCTRTYTSREAERVCTLLRNDVLVDDDDDERRRQKNAHIHTYTYAHTFTHKHRSARAAPPATRRVTLYRARHVRRGRRRSRALASKHHKGRRQKTCGGHYTNKTTEKWRCVRMGGLRGGSLDVTSYAITYETPVNA